MIGNSSIVNLNELNQAYLHKLFTNGDKVYVFRFLRLVLHSFLIWRDLDSSLLWRFDEPSITRNGQSRPCGRHTLIEIDLIRLEAVFVAMLCTRWMCCTRCEVSSIFFKGGIKVGFKVLSWWTWTKYAGVLLSFVDRKCFWFCIYYEVFLKYLCEHPRVRLTVW